MAVAKDTQQFCVRWNSYQSNLQSAFPKLLTSEHFVDVTLACESRMVKCHKLVLSACSAYFEKLLVQNPCPHPIIFMKDMKYWEVQALVDFMYKGEVNVTQEELGTLLKAAEALEVRGLCGQQDQGQAAADKLALPRDTVMAGETQKKRKTEADPKDDANVPAKLEVGANSSVNPTSNNGGGAGGPPSSLAVAKSPNSSQQHPELAKMNNPTPITTPSTNVKQEINVADNGLFEDLDDDFYQDDNSLQIDETGSAYSLPGPSGQPPLDNSPASSALIFCKTAFATPFQGKEETYEDVGADRLVDTNKLDIAESAGQAFSDSFNSGFEAALVGGHCPKRLVKSGKRRHISLFHSAAQDLLSGRTLLAVSAAYSIPRSTLHDYMKKNGLIRAWRESRCTTKQNLFN